MPITTYPFGPVGNESTNLIPREIHTLSELNDAVRRIIIPKFAPFHLNNIKVEHRQDDGVIVTLKEGLDYSFALEYLAATRSIGSPVYGGIQVKNLLTNGEILVTYQTVGGSFAANSAEVLQNLASKAYNPRTTTWDVVTNVQQLFPPIAHDQSYDYVYGQKEVVEALRALEAAMLADKSDTIMAAILKVTNNINKETVGLGNLENLAIATSEDVRLRRKVPKLPRLDHLVEHGLGGGGGGVSLGSAALYWMTQSKT